MVSFHYCTPLLLVLLILSALIDKSSSQSFKCSSTDTCYSLVDYVSPNRTTLSEIRTLFSVRSIRSLLGANDLHLSTSPNQTVAAKQTIKIPFPCVCANGTGLSNRKPVYTVKKDDTLYHIAAELFSGLVTFQEIARVNEIPNPDLIAEGQDLWIPLPCSCDDVDGERVVHYGYVVEAGNSFALIAEKFGTTRDTLMRLNGISNDSSLLAGQVLDVPLQACNSSVHGDSIDYPLLVANGTYVVTANGCVKCKCDSSNNWTLNCEPSGLKATNWTTCPAMQCQVADNNTLYLSNTTTSGCNVTTCAYAGFYANQTILTTLATESTCPANSPSGTTPDNAARMGLSWNLLWVSISLILLPVHILR